MTAPVMDVVTAGAGPFCNSSFDIGFFIPYDLQGDPSNIPTPTDADVHIDVSTAWRRGGKGRGTAM